MLYSVSTFQAVFKLLNTTKNVFNIVRIHQYLFMNRQISKTLGILQKKGILPFLRKHFKFKSLLSEGEYSWKPQYITDFISHTSLHRTGFLSKFIKISD